MKRNLAFILAALGWFAVIAQYYLMIENRTISVSEATIRFFNFFYYSYQHTCSSLFQYYLHFRK
ncbi:hypothetical protein [Elizabethkingia anophelis]|uniref:hypothetical protein n=1 Tax=Elizabethkingia anophelis TaxID=1117645 RepID=UPI001F463339|nr:hypothetical protein [Elizabethkingia anophelis]